jgi:hypothetical protein
MGNVPSVPYSHIVRESFPFNYFVNCLIDIERLATSQLKEITDGGMNPARKYRELIIVPRKSENPHIVLVPTVSLDDVPDEDVIFTLQAHRKFILSSGGLPRNLTFFGRLDEKTH